MNKFKLVKSDDGSEVVSGQRVQTFRGELVVVESFRDPQHAGSTGKVWVRNAIGSNMEFYPSVIGCKIVSV